MPLDRYDLRWLGTFNDQSGDGPLGVNRPRLGLHLSVPPEQCHMSSRDIFKVTEVDLLVTPNVRRFNSCNLCIKGGLVGSHGF